MLISLWFVSDDHGLRFAQNSEANDIEERIAWHLIARGVLIQVGEEELAHTEISKRYLPGLPDTVVFSFW